MPVCVGSLSFQKYFGAAPGQIRLAWSSSASGPKLADHAESSLQEPFPGGYRKGSRCSVGFLPAARQNCLTPRRNCLRTGSAKANGACTAKARNPVISEGEGWLMTSLAQYLVLVYDRRHTIL